MLKHSLRHSITAPQANINWHSIADIPHMRAKSLKRPILGAWGCLTSSPCETGVLTLSQACNDHFALILGTSHALHAFACFSYFSWFSSSSDLIDYVASFCFIFFSSRRFSGVFESSILPRIHPSIIRDP